MSEIQIPANGEGIFHMCPTDKIISIFHVKGKFILHQGLIQKFMLDGALFISITRTTLKMGRISFLLRPPP